MQLCTKNLTVMWSALDVSQKAFSFTDPVCSLNYTRYSYYQRFIRNSECILCCFIADSMYFI